jgi:type I restriction enzyme S subunit
MMDLNMLLEKFDLLMDSPNSTARMRKLILQLAVQGKLVEQDPTEEPAGELLKRIKAEKEKLIAEGKIKKQKPLPPISKDEIPYELPRGWEWVRMKNIAYNMGQKKPDKRFTSI